MTPPSKEFSDIGRVMKALSAAGATDLAAVEEQTVTFALHNGVVIPGQIRIAGKWTVTQFGLPEPGVDLYKADAPVLWTLLTINKQLPAGMKLVLGQKGQVRFLCEARLADDSLEQRLASACTVVRHAVKQSREPGAPLFDIRGLSTPAPSLLWDKEFAPICEVAGWPAHRRTTGVVAVKLDTEAESHQALLSPEPTPTARVRLRVGDAPGPVTRAAAAALLLKAAAQFRMVRPIAEEAGGAQFEVAWDTAPKAEDVVDALAALSVAVGACGGVCTAMADPAVAGRYLAQQVYPR